MASAPAIPLRFQRQELQLHADLSPAGVECLASVRGPQDMIAALIDSGAHDDAVAALAMMLPRRQAVWWSCLATRLIPDLASRPAELEAIETAEAWVHSQRVEDTDRARSAAERSPMRAAATYVALATFWCGPSLAPRGQQAVPPPAHLPGTGVRVAMTLLMADRTMLGRLSAADLLGIGTALMHGDLGRTAQSTLAERLSPQAAIAGRLAVES